MLYAVLYCLVLSGLQYTFTNITFGQDDIILISKDKEKSIGDAIAKQVEKQYKGVDDPLLQKRFEEIGKKISAVCGRQDLVYHFKVLKAKKDDDEYFNAFSLPGGYVYMFEPMMQGLKTDDKIAAVTAHEIAHICARHAVKRLQDSLGVNALMVLALATAQKGSTVLETNEALTQLMMAYSREDEFEADRLSIGFVKKAGFNPNGVLQSLYTLQALRKKGPDRKYTNYKSHPYLSERIASARVAIKGYADFDSYINLPQKKDDF